MKENYTNIKCNYTHRENVITLARLTRNEGGEGGTSPVSREANVPCRALQGRFLSKRDVRTAKGDFVGN